MKTRSTPPSTLVLFVALFLSASALRAADIVWTNLLGGNWNTAANWDPNQVPGASDNAFITNAGTYTVTVNANATVANVNVGTTSGNQTLSLDGGTFTLVSTGSLSDMGILRMAGGTLSGGTVTTSGGAKLMATTSGGTLDGVTVNGDLDVTPGQEVRVSVVNGLTLNGTATVGMPGFVWARMEFFGSQTLGGNGTVIFGDGHGPSLRVMNNGTTLTLGPGITVRRGSDQSEPGYIGFIPPLGSDNPSVSVVNQGNILADTSGRTIRIRGESFVNNGLIGASNGGLLDVGNLRTNTGQVLVEGGTVALGGNWVNTGVINTTNATLNLGGTFTVAGLGVLNRSGGAVNLTGTLLNTNATLALNAASGSWVLAGGAIQRGTVSMVDGAKLTLSTSSGTLDGVTVNGDLDQTPGQEVRVSVVNGLTLNGTATLGMPGFVWARMEFFGSQTLGGNGTVVFGDGHGPSLRVMDNGTTLTIGPGITVRRGSDSGEPAYIGFLTPYGGNPSVSVVNQGNILADTSGRTIRIRGESFVNHGLIGASNGGLLDVGNLRTNTGQVLVEGGTVALGGNWVNTGVINTTNATLNLGGTFTVAGLGVLNRSGGAVNLTGTLLNTNATLALNAASGSWVLAGGAIQRGTVSMVDGAKLTLSTSSGTLDGVTVNGDLDQTPGQEVRVSVVNGLTLNGTATLGMPGFVWARMEFFGSQTLGGNGTVVFGDGHGPSLRVMDNGTTLTIGPGITVRRGSDSGEPAYIGFLTPYGGNASVSVVNQGSILADTSGRTIRIRGESFVNQGLIGASNGGLLDIGCPFTQIAGQTLVNGGTISCSSPMQILGGILGGTGAITGSVTNNGLISPGVSPGLLTITGDYTQTPGGILLIELAGNAPGTSFDRLAVGGTATLAGTLISTLTNGFYPQTNALFTFLSCTARSGTFAAFNYPSNDVGMRVNYTPTDATIEVINVRPVLTAIPNQTHDELVVFNHTATATDDDFPTQTLTFALTNSPAAAMIHPNSGLLTWTPSETDGPGTNSLTVLVTDSGTPNLTVSRAFELVVNEINVAPVLTLPPNHTLNEQTVLSLNATATDSDVPTNALMFELVSGPSGLTVSSLGVIDWTPTEAQGSNSYTVKIRVTDTNQFAVNEKQLSTTNMFMITVNEVNLPPSLTVPGPQTLTEETPLAVSASATDPDLPINGLLFTLVSPPTGMTIHATSGVIDWTPAEDQGSNTFTIKVVVTDDSPNAVNTKNFSVTNIFTVIVNESNRPPVLGALADYTVNAGQTISFTATATDPDLPTNTLAFSLISPPAGATLDSGSGLFQWRVKAVQADTTNVIQVRAMDDGIPNRTDTKSFTVIVNPIAPLVLTPISYTSGQFTMSVTGPIGPDYIIQSSTNLIDWSNLHTNTPASVPFNYTDTNAGAFGSRFYRALLDP